jgi:hypothetical protein
MAPILTAEDVVRRIAPECAFVDERGGVGIQPEPAAIVLRCGSNSTGRRGAGGRASGIATPPTAGFACLSIILYLVLQFYDFAKKIDSCVMLGSTSAS